MVESKNSDEETPLLASTSFGDNYGNGTARTRTKGQGQPNDTRSFGDGNWRSRLRDADHRAKVIRSLEACLCTFSVGLVTGQMGPALLDLQIITQTTVQEAATFLTAASAGNIVGSAMSGFIYDNCNKNLMLILSELFMGLTLLVIPFCSYYWLMVTVCFLNNVFRISCTNVANVEIFTVWGTQAASFLYARQISYSIGAIISPLITEPFLAPRNTSTTNTNDCATCSTRGNNHTYDLDRGTNIVTRATHDANMPETPTTRVHFAFMITAAVCVVITALLVADYIRMCRGKATRISSIPEQNGDGKSASTVNEEVRGPNNHENCVMDQSAATEVNGKQQNEKPSNSSSVLNLSMVQYVIVTMWVSLFYFLAIGASNSSASYWATYAVLQMEWSKSEGAFLSSVYWFCISFVQVLCFLLASFFKPLQFLVTAFILWTPSLVAVILMSLYHVDWGVWLCTAFSGIAISPVYASSFAWLNANLVTVTGKVNSAISLSIHLGTFVSLSIVGSFIDSNGAIWFLYVVLGESILAGLVFVSLYLFSHFYLRPKYSGRGRTEIEINGGTQDRI